MRDTLPPKPNLKEAGVLNFDVDSGPGTHWVCWFKDGDRKFYFDSYGADPPVELRKYLGSNILVSTSKLQRYGTNYCGQLCVYVLKRLDSGFPIQKILMNIRDNKWNTRLQAQKSPRVVSSTTR